MSKTCQAQRHAMKNLFAAEKAEGKQSLIVRALAQLANRQVAHKADSRNPEPVSVSTLESLRHAKAHGHRILEALQQQHGKQLHELQNLSVVEAHQAVALDAHFSGYNPKKRGDIDWTGAKLSGSEVLKPLVSELPGIDPDFIIGRLGEVSVEQAEAIVHLLFIAPFAAAKQQMAEEHRQDVRAQPVAGASAQAENAETEQVAA